MTDGKLITSFKRFIIFYVFELYNKKIDWCSSKLSDDSTELEEGLCK